MPKGSKPRAGATGRRTRSPSPTGHLMTDNEWDDFWKGIDAKRQRQAEEVAWEPAQPPSEDEHQPDDEPEEAPMPLEFKPEPLLAAEAPAKSKTNRLNRCGNCPACRSKDCGTCKNCLDKPRFGGPGIKKKACMSRVCKNTLQPNAARDELSDADTTPNSSPALRACAALALPPPINLHDSFRRQPLLPIDMQPVTAPTTAQPQPPLLPHLQHAQFDTLSRPPSVTRAH